MRGVVIDHETGSHMGLLLIEGAGVDDRTLSYLVFDIRSREIRERSINKLLEIYYYLAFAGQPKAWY